MREVLTHRDYRLLFSAQVIALIGTGLLTVALGLLAYDLTGADGGRVLGLAMTVKILAYVFAAPVMAAATARIPRRTVMVSADLVRAAIALTLPFVTETWQVYVLVFALQTASATFTPTFQSVIPDILPRERDYTRALSLSRLAYNLEAIGSPLIAAALLTVIAPSGLFVGTVVGFLASAGLVLAARVPARAGGEAAQAPFAQRVTHGVRLFTASPELRGLFFLYGSVAAGTAMIIVNTPVLVRAHLGLGEPEVPLLLAAGGLGEMLIALVLPRLLDRRPDRPLMVAGGVRGGLLPVPRLVHPHVPDGGRRRVGAGHGADRPGARRDRRGLCRGGGGVAALRPAGGGGGRRRVSADDGGPDLERSGPPSGFGAPPISLAKTPGVGREGARRVVRQRVAEGRASAVR